jgi:hypothetical protein
MEKIQQRRRWQGWMGVVKGGERLYHTDMSWEGHSIQRIADAKALRQSDNCRKSYG